MKRLTKSILLLIASTFTDLCNKISDGINARDIRIVISNVVPLIFLLVFLVLTGGFLVWLILQHMVLFIICGFIAAAVYSAILKLRDDAGSPYNSSDPVDIVVAEQEAEEVHPDIRTLTYNAIVDVSEYMQIHRPRDEYGIETSRERPYRMDGIMVVHQFEVDHNGSLDRASIDTFLRESQRYINKHARRYPQLMRDGHPPVIFDAKDNGNFLLVEVVLYSEGYKDKIEARKRARIENRHRQERIDDPRYK